MIEYNLDKKLKNVSIIEGFPSFGMVSTLAIEFILDHLDCERVGEFVYDELPPTAVIHEGELVKPMSIWYNEEHNLLILHTTLGIQDLEWDMADLILELAEEVDAKEIISIEGISTKNENTKAYTHKHEALLKSGAEPLDEAIFMGITAALMLKSDKAVPLFAEAHSKLPDGQAAAKIVEVLDQYYDLDIDYGPLLEKGEKFEKKLQDIFEKTKKSQMEAKKRKLNYFG